jgi:homoserine O-acetyltransferase
MWGYLKTRCLKRGFATTVLTITVVMSGLLGPSAAVAQRVIVGEQHTMTFAEPPNELVLESGEKLGPITVVYRTAGQLDPDGRNAILVLAGRGGAANCGGLTGPGKPFDTDKYFVVCPDGLAGGTADDQPGTGTTGPHSINPRTGKRYAMSFPVFLIRDMVRVNMELLKRLGVKHLLVVSGVSLGGEQSWEWLVTYPDFMDGVIPMVGRPRSSPWHMSRHVLQRAFIMSDPDWQGGNYYGTGRFPARGMALSAALSAISYNNSPDWHPDNFDEVDPTNSATSGYRGLLNMFKFEKFVMQRFLDANNAKPPTGLDANCALYQDWAGSRVNIAYGRAPATMNPTAQLHEAFKLAKADVLAMPSRTDASMLPRFAQEAVDILHSLNKRASIHVIDSEEGHGGARDLYQTIPPITKFIEGLPGAKGQSKTSTRGASGGT